MFRKRILLVDDEPNLRTLLTAVLERRGFQVTTAEDGFAALRRLRAEVPDLIVSDLRMPNMNGFELLAVVRDKFPNIPVVAISGEFVGEEVEGVLADVFLQKGSYTPETMIETINLLLSRTATRVRRSNVATTWAATGDADVMLTCSECLRSFPLDPCSSEDHPSKEISCIFCGAKLRYRLIAITKAV
jgi:CheY-like chemotaxis protein